MSFCARDVFPLKTLVMYHKPFSDNDHPSWDHNVQKSIIFSHRLTADLSWWRLLLHPEKSLVPWRSFSISVAQSSAVHKVRESLGVHSLFMGVLLTGRFLALMINQAACMLSVILFWKWSLLTVAASDPCKHPVGVGQEVATLTIRPDNRSSIPRIPVVGQNQLLQAVSLTPTEATACTCLHTRVCLHVYVSVRMLTHTLNLCNW